MDTDGYELGADWFTPERCTWVVEEDNYLNPGDVAVNVQPRERDMRVEDVDYIRAQLNRPSEASYFGFNAKSPDFDAFVTYVQDKLVEEDVDFLLLPREEQHKWLKKRIFSAMAQVFWE